MRVVRGAGLLTIVAIAAAVLIMRRRDREKRG
jgi:hypothetical protein